MRFGYCTKLTKFDVVDKPWTPYKKSISVYQNFSLVTFKWICEERQEKSCQHTLERKFRSSFKCRPGETKETTVHWTLTKTIKLKKEVNVKYK